MNEVTPPFPPLAEAWPWLAGQGSALVLVAVVGVLVLRGEDAGRKRGALGWALAATAMPVAWLVARWVPGAVEVELPLRIAVGAGVGLAVHGFVAWAGVYLSNLAAAIEQAPRRGGSRSAPEEPTTAPPKQEAPPEEATTAPPKQEARPKEATTAPPKQEARPKEATTAPPKEEARPKASPQPKPRARPTIKPPSGSTVAAALPEADALLRVLAEGTPMQQAAAAKALSLSFAGTGSKAVMHGLLDAVMDEGGGEDVRVEAWVAACQVVGDPLPWEVESKLRMEGPAGIDPAQVMAWVGRID